MVLSFSRVIFQSKKYAVLTISLSIIQGHFDRFYLALLFVYKHLENAAVFICLSLDSFSLFLFPSAFTFDMIFSRKGFVKWLWLFSDI